MAKRSGKPRRRADGHSGAAAEARSAAEERNGPEEGPGILPGSQTAALSRAVAAIRRGDFRTARSLAREIAAHGEEKDQEQARRLLGNLSVDPAALVAAACVLLVIVVAAVLALFRAR